VRFSVESAHPYPFNLCYCSICRKTAGAGGFAINVCGDFNTLEIEGRENIRFYQALVRDSEYAEPRQSRAQRHFCTTCGSALWLWDPGWPNLVHPHASAIDTQLPIPPQRTHFMLASKANWVEVGTGPHDKCFPAYPDESIAAWHERLHLADNNQDG
jgi:hypothetical protein